MKNINIYWIDLFCGGGGTTTGIHLVGENTTVLACVNHDKNAIESHKANHPDALHFTEDIRDFKVIDKLRILVENLRAKEPNCVINLWASLECTNFSKAKGGLPRDADSRTLANHMKYYIEAINPDYFYVENVREFLAWGPLDEKGKPISRLNGEDFLKWNSQIKTYGYNSKWEILNSANYSAYQSRERLFIIYSKIGLPIKFPEQTHSKDGSENDLFGYKKWKPVKEILDLKDEGNSIFTRNKPLAENTLKRIYAGLEKFVSKGDNVFSKTYNSGNDKNRVRSVDSVINTITTANTHSLVFISNYKSGHPESKNHSINKPIGTVSTVPTQSIVKCDFLSPYYGISTPQSIDIPCNTITTKDRFAKVNVSFIDQQYGNSLPKTINEPCNTLTANPKFNLVNTEQFLFNPQYSDKGRSIERPCFTLIARMDKTPPSIISVNKGNVSIHILPEDSETMIKIKKFMVLYQITDIKIRMLKIPELLQIQGFPKDYKLVGTQAEQKKYIGNAVEVNMAKALAKANAEAIYDFYNKKNIA